MLACPVSGDFLIRHRSLQPSNANERKLIHPNGLSILFKIAPSEAEKLSDQQKSSIYIVLKIKVNLKGLEPYDDAIKSTYTLESPIIELFWDDDLSLKATELSIDTMITK